MSVAALQAVALDGWLRGGAGTRAFQRRAARVGSGAWLIATGEDLRYAETKGPPIRLQTKVINRYVSRVVGAANVDRRVCARLLDVLALRSRPETLFLPRAVLRVMTADRSAAPLEADLVSGAEPDPPAAGASSGR
jgi:hypothetical protein